MLATVATLPAISPTLFTVGINFLVNQLLGAGEEAISWPVVCAGLLKFNKWVGAEELGAVVWTGMGMGRAAVLERE